MPLTTKQLEKRKQDIGASEVSAICGVNPYATPWDIWALKTLVMHFNIEDSEAIEIGNALEPVLRKWAEKTLGPIKRQGLERRIKGTPMLIHLDGVTVENEPTEMKTTGFGGGGIVGEWGNEGTDQIPDYVLIQLTVQMMAVESDAGHVAAWLGSRGRVLYRVQRSTKLCGVIRERVEAFWECVMTETPPPDSVASPEVAKAIKRVEHKVVEVDAADLAMLRITREHRLDIEKEEKQWAGKVMAAMGDAEIAFPKDADDPTNLVMTYLNSPRTIVDLGKLRREHPDVYEQCLKTVDSRTKRFPKRLNIDTSRAIETAKEGIK